MTVMQSPSTPNLQNAQANGTSTTISNMTMTQSPSTPVQNAPLLYNELAVKCKISQVIPKKHLILKRIKYDHTQAHASGSAVTVTMTESDPVLRLDVPLGTRWSNNSCAYDAVFVILFNIWRENPIASSTLWRTLESELLDMLITSFETHVSFHASGTSQQSQHFSLEEIKDFMRRRLARISTEFIFGHYT